jgi:hypothetical protein
MLPVTPTRDWNTIPDHRRVISPDEDNQGNNNNNNNNNNPFRLLEDSDSDDDESASRQTSGGTATALESITASLRDPGTTDHLLGAAERIVVDLREYFLNTPIIDTPDRFAAFTAASNREYNRINGIEIANNENDSNSSIPPLSN